MGSFAPKGHARLDPQRPSAFAICDQCGFLYLHRELKWAVQWMGNQVRKTGFLVCPTCWDQPNPTLRPGCIRVPSWRTRIFPAFTV